MREIITRRVDFSEHNVWFTTSSIKYENSFEPEMPWINCLYIHYIKSSWDIIHPTLVNGNFNYFESSIASLDWHGGITFYEETKNIVQDRIYVKAGCDYLHLWDEDYRREDCGAFILKSQSKILLKQFLELKR